MNVRALLREVRELGAGRTIYRIRRELELRSGLERLRDELRARQVLEAPPPALALARWRALCCFERPQRVASAMEGRLAEDARARLRDLAGEARRGRILAFGRWIADYGDPIDWNLNPRTGERWSPAVHWSAVLRDEPRVGDVKHTWEAGRFPQAFLFARAAAFDLDAEANAKALGSQVRAFVSNAPFPYGVHWNSGQEIAIRWMAWHFALSALDALGADVRALVTFLVRRAHRCGAHVEANFDYVRKAVYNNHLLTEAWALLYYGELTGERRWRDAGVEELTRQASRQVYLDGSYVQQSHNYHRVAVNTYLLACRTVEASGARAPAEWRGALSRSLDFLHAHQNPQDGRLPNYGANDGAEILPLSSCDFSDFRPVLQTTSLYVRGERLYEPGPWDEHAAWLLGAPALEAPLRPRPRTSVSFADTGHHVLRCDEPGTFATFRCGTLRERFSQMDMLHLDLWWKGQNVLVDGGSYQYNGADQRWHDYFLRTASHNTLTVDGREQMVHHRRFKVLYWTRAKTLRFDHDGRRALAIGEHYGFARGPRPVIHRRSVLLDARGVTMVFDHLLGDGEHDVRSHWLCGEFPYRAHPDGIELVTPEGAFHVATHAVVAGAPVALATTIACGDESPPRGWQARYYGERQAVPSLASEARAPLPLTLCTVMSAARAEIACDGDDWTVRVGARTLRARLVDGAVAEVS